MTPEHPDYPSLEETYYHLISCNREVFKVNRLISPGIHLEWQICCCCEEKTKDYIKVDYYRTHMSNNVLVRVICRDLGVCAFRRAVRT